jgi:SAM-dependent methyltransferase
MNASSIRTQQYGIPGNVEAIDNLVNCVPDDESLDFDAESFLEDCRLLAKQKYGVRPTSYIAARIAIGYYSPEDQYAALVNRLVSTKTNWLDIGCGRAPFPNNLALSRETSRRCRKFVGVDPDSGINENTFVHERHQIGIEDFFPASTFSLVTARMVVEHVENPLAFAAALARSTNPGSIVIIFTVNWWSLSTLAAYFSPMSVHHWAKRWLWKSDEKDSFPTKYKMNRRESLNSIMRQAGFEEHSSKILADASLLWRLPGLRWAELALYKGFKRLGLPYIDTCILAVYRRVSQR